MMSRKNPPKKAKTITLNWVDYALFGMVLALIAFITWRVNDVLVYNWDWGRVFGFVARIDDETGKLVSNILIEGLFTTIRLAIWSTILATIIGVVMGYWRRCNTLALRIISRIYVELIRNIPPIVFIFIFYFFISSQFFPLLGLDSLPSDGLIVESAFFHVLFGTPNLFENFIAGLICLAIFEGAYITEIVRAGIQSIEKGQWEAAKAIGLSHFSILRDVILPQAVRKILPPLAGQFITLIKDSAIVSLISIQELTFIAIEVAATTTRVFETWILVGLMYFFLCYSFAYLFGYLEKRSARSKR